MPNDKKFTKSEVKYGPSKNPAKHRCGICEFHLHVPGTDRLECSIVKGPIKKMDGCKLFSVDLIHAATDKIDLANHPSSEN